MTLNKKGHQELVVKRKGKPTEHTLNELEDEMADLVEEIMTPLPNPSAEYAISSEMPTEYRDANRPPFNDLDPFVMDPVIVGNDRGTACARAERNDKVRANHDELSNWAPGSGGETEYNPLEGRSLEQQKDSIPASNYYTAKFVDKNTNNPVLTDRDLDPDYATSECVSSTAGIASGVMNSFFTPTGRGRMKSRRRLMREFTPDFEPGNYKPGNPEMRKPKGQGLADKKPKPLGYGEADVELHEIGEPLGMKRKHNLAMGQATDGAEEEAPHYESEHGDVLDANQDWPDVSTDEVGHNWPAAPKNKGGSTEAFPGTRWTDGGVLSPRAMAAEGWNPKNIGVLTEGVDENIVRHLFNNWVRGIRQVRLSDFENLLHANGIEFAMNESAFENLLAAHDRIVFHEGQDSNGKYWIGENAEMPEFIKKKMNAKKGKHVEGEDEDCEDGVHCEDEDMMGHEQKRRVAYKQYLKDFDRGIGNMKSQHYEPKPGLHHFSGDHGEFMLQSPCSFAEFNEYCDEHGDYKSEEGLYGPVSEDAKFKVAKKKYLTDEGNGATDVGEVFADTELSDHGQIDTLLRGEPENNNEETPIYSETGVGIPVKKAHGNGAVAIKSLQENIQKLSNHVAPHLLRAQKRINGPYTASYCVLESKKGKKAKKGNMRRNLAEALVDAEENIQYGSAQDNFLIAQYRRPNGAVLFQQTIPLLTINHRTPMMAEGKVLFRSQANAARYMSVLKESKSSSCIDRHPYGFAVRKI
jgi:hypothetical protein